MSALYFILLSIFCIRSPNYARHRPREREREKERETKDVLFVYETREVPTVYFGVPNEFL